MQNQMELVFPALACNEAFARVAIAAFAVQLNPTLPEMADVKTAVSEAVTNAIVHGYAHASGKVRLRAECRQDGLLIVDVIDHGCGIADIAQARQPFFTSLNGEERSGMGFTVMESFMDCVEVQSELGKGTLVRLIKQLNLREECLARRA